MRPILVLTVVALMAVAAVGQQPFSHPIYGPFYGPYIPVVTTPEVSLQQYSPNPVGATNATAGLTAGATNATLSEMQGSTNAVYTVPVWYQGGDAPLTTPQIHLLPQSVNREGRGVHEMMREERVREERATSAEARGGWTFYTNWDHTSSASDAAKAAKGMRKAGHVYTNDDVTRQNDNNGTVKHDGKTEKM